MPEWMMNDTFFSFIHYYICKCLFIDTVSMNKKYRVDTVSMNKKYRVDTLSTNKKYRVDTVSTNKKYRVDTLSCKILTFWKFFENLFFSKFSIFFKISKSFEIYKIFQNLQNFVKFCEDLKWSTFWNSASLNTYLLTLNSDWPVFQNLLPL